MKTAQALVRNKLTVPNGFRKWCRDNFTIVQFISKGRVIDTTNRKKENRYILKKKLQSNTNFRQFSETIYCHVVCVAKDKMEIQTYQVIKRISKQTLKEEFQYRLYNLRVYQNNEIYKVCLGYYNTYVFGTNQLSGLGFFKPQELYPIHEELQSQSPLRMIKTKLLGAYDLDFLYEKRHNLYFAEKHSMKNMFDDILNNVIDYRIMTKRRIKDYWQYIATYDLDYHDFTVLIKLVNLGIKVNKINFEALPNIDCEINISKHSNYGIVRLMNYLFKQERQLSYYYDYLNTLVDIKAPASTDIEFFPRNLINAHDRAVGTLNAMQRELEEKQLIKITKKLRLLEYSNDQYEVVCPKSFQDIIDEGKRLAHCVGGSRYIEGHKNKEFAIMFLRKKDSPKKSWITFTYEYNKRITAVHGKGNRDSNIAGFNEAKDFLLNEWLSWVKKGCQKPKKYHFAKSAKKPLSKGDIERIEL